MKPYGLYPADILLPKQNYEAWAVVACDQYTSQPDYWQEVERQVGEKPSTLRITLPEVYLNDSPDVRIETINRTMREYLAQDVLQEHPGSMVYVEREQSNGRVRRGLVGMIDLETYDYAPGSHCAIRATEQTVVERIPPRLKIRENAVLELPHVLLMVDDPKGTLIESLAETAHQLPLLYDFDLMQQGGHVSGRLLDQAAMERVSEALYALSGGDENELLFVVGDGNHTLATAKEWYRQHPTPLTRYALVEVVNIHDASIEFEPIYRVLFGVEPEELLREFTDAYGLSATEDAHEFTCLFGDMERVLRLAHTAKLPVDTLQTFLDAYLARHPEASIDYIHGEDVVRRLSHESNALGFLFNSIGKAELFPAVKADGALPRKSFSMGQAQDKRYYIECRRIRED